MKKNKTIMDKNLVICLLLIILIFLIIIPKEIVEEPSIIGHVLAQVRIISGTLPPSFDFNLTNQTVNQSGTFILDVNCSDAEAGDTITYYDNFTGFEINSSTGMINQTQFANALIGNNTIGITCGDGTNNVSQTFVLTIIDDTNNAPVLSSIGNQIATESSLFTLDVDATDADGDSFTFSSNSTIFTINNITGLINFTPSIINVGNHTINISVSDSRLADWEVITFTVVRGPFCGDSSCGSGETCASCSSDCGSCASETVQPEAGAETTTSGAGGGEAGAGGAASVTGGAGRAPFYRCDEKWECSEWSKCSIDGIRSRKCKDINKCITKQKKPIEIEGCEYQPTCDDRIKNGDEDGVDCGGACKPCFVPSCSDGILNQDEEGIDCGGACNPCEIKKFAKIPFVELPSIIKIPKMFPWILVLVISILIVLAITSDQIYVRRLTKKEFEEYRKKLQKYRSLRRKIYKSAANALLITLIASLHIYSFSDSTQNMIRYAWVPIIIILLVPVAVSSAISRFAYYEYKKKTKEERLKQTHKREILQLIDIENQLLVDIEAKLKDKLYSLAVKHSFDNYPELYTEINPLYGLLANIGKSRRERTRLTRISAEIFKKMSELAEDKALLGISKEYPEFVSVLKILEHILDNINIDTYYNEEELLEEIREISKPHMMTVIKSSRKLVGLYNDLVGIYEYFVSKHQSLQGKDKETSGIERDFTEKIKGIAKNAAVINIIQKNADFASMYNSFVDLFNHYMKKQELRTKMRDL